MKATLTASHDIARAWTGVGSALAALVDQIAVPSSTVGTLSVAGYLLSISILHITTPALFSVETFAQSIPTTVTTTGFPLLNGTLNYDNIQQVAHFHPLRSTLISNLNKADLALYASNGSLYEVLDVDSGQGLTKVNAKGFNITCGYLSGVHTGMGNSTDVNRVKAASWEIVLDTHNVGELSIFDTRPNILRILGPVENGLVLYSTTGIIDSEGNTGVSVKLNPPMSNVSELYFFQCSNSVVPQDKSIWRLSDTLPQLSNSSMDPVNIMSWWADIITRYTTDTALLSNTAYNWDIVAMLSLADVYLMEEAGISTSTDAGKTGPTLYDVENAISKLAASVLWIVGHISGIGQKTFDASGARLFSGDGPWLGATPPMLTPGTAVVGIPTIASRLNLNIVAVSVGMAASVALLSLAIPHLRQPVGHGQSLDGTGILHVIWLFRNNPEWAEVIPQIDDPTDQELRAAAMVEVSHAPPSTIAYAPASRHPGTYRLIRALTLGIQTRFNFARMRHDLSVFVEGRCTMTCFLELGPLALSRARKLSLRAMWSPADVALARMLPRTLASTRPRSPPLSSFIPTHSQ
ncbi:hypothetical protein B0H13DRAFT_2654929 [Mycena leptocephala]|nr:hypothetical protein B0H13DRAFT_2654929 [Mycena leptocephala]